jgi:hypothetical protein
MTSTPWRVAVVLVLVCCIGCAGKMSRVTTAIKAYEAALTLRAEAPTPAAFASEPIALHLTLFNKGSRPVTACLGPNQRLLLRANPMLSRDGRPPIDECTTLVDHPTCERRFTLASGQELSWSTKAAFKDIGAGDAEIDVSVQVLHPADCDQYGCYGTMIAAPAVPVQIVRHP